MPIYLLYNQKKLQHNPKAKEKIIIISILLFKFIFSFIIIIQLFLMFYKLTKYIYIYIFIIIIQLILYLQIFLNILPKKYNNHVIACSYFLLIFDLVNIMIPFFVIFPIF